MHLYLTHIGSDFSVLVPFCFCLNFKKHRFRSEVFGVRTFFVQFLYSILYSTELCAVKLLFLDCVYKDKFSGDVVAT